MEKHEPKQIVFAKNKGEYAKPKKEMIERRKRRIELESKRMLRQIERDDMDTLLTLEEAARFCRYDNKESFRHAVHAYGLPVIKLGKKLLFCKQDLLEHLKSHHNVSAVRGGTTKEDKKCHLSNEVTHGILISAHQTDQEYDRVLRLATSN